MRLATEFRHDSWFHAEIYRLLARHCVALCIADGLRHARKDVVTTDFAYLRYHGRTPVSAPDYSEIALRREAAMIRRFAEQGINVYAYFNNDAQGHAVKNANMLRSLVMSER